MKNYFVVVERLYTYELKVQATDEGGAELLARIKLNSSDVTPSDFNEYISVIDKEEEEG